MPRPWKGPRYARTVRFPVDMNKELEKAAPRAGYDNVGDYVVAIVARAQSAGAWPAEAPGQKQLPMRLPKSA